MANYTKVTIKFSDNTTQNINIERGVTFENNGAKYKIDENGKLKKMSKTNSNSVWEDADVIDMNKYQYRIFQAFADNDEKKDNLSKKDIELALKQYKNNEFKKDITPYLNGYTINDVKKNKNNISIDLSQGNSKGVLTFGLCNESQKTTKTEKPNEKTAKTETAKNGANKTDFDIKTMFNEIPKEYDKYIKQAAKEAGVSEDFIRFMILTEGKKCNAVLEPYVCSGGKLTIGFGHTNATGTNPFNKNSKITLQDAFNYLVADIKKQKQEVINTIGEDKYNKLPHNVQLALIDWSFNAGADRFRNSANFNANLDNNDYIGILTTSLWNEDDARRSIFRLMFATQDCNTNDASRIKQFLNRNMRSESHKHSTYYENTGKTLGENTLEREQFEKYYNNLLT